MSDYPIDSADSQTPAGTAPVRPPLNLARTASFAAVVILPLLALAGEITSQVGATRWDDPLPTWLHIGLVAAVPCCLVCGWRVVGHASPTRRQIDLAIGTNAFAVTVCGIYALWLLSSFGETLALLLLMGLGVVALWPVFTGLAALRLRRILIRKRGESVTANRAAHSKRWVLAALALFAFGELPGLATQFAVHALASETSPDSTRSRALAWLRFATNEQDFLSAASDRQYKQRAPRELVYALIVRNPAEIAEAAYLTHGYTLAESRYRRLPTHQPGWDRTMDVDWSIERGGDAVGYTLRELVLLDSTIKAQLHTPSATARLHWTLLLQYNARRGTELRTVIELPPGAVLTAAKVSYDGKEEVAAFASTCDAPDRWKQPEADDRPPLLINWMAAGEILVQSVAQAVPVIDTAKFTSSQLGVLQLDLDITAPLVVTEDQERLRLPYWSEANFQPPPTPQHHIIADAGGTPLAWLSLGENTPPTSPLQTTLDERVPAGDFSHGAPVIFASRPAAFSPSYARIAGSPADVEVVRQYLRPPSDTPPGRICVVVDGSAPLASAREVVAGALATAQPTRFAGVYLACDGVRCAPVPVSPASASEWIRRQAFIGGQDCTQALLTAIDKLATEGGGTVLLLSGRHGPDWHPDGVLGRRLAMRSGKVRVTVFPLITPKRSSEIESTPSAYVTRVERMGSLDYDLANLLGPVRPQWTPERTVVARRSAGDPLSISEVPTLYALWAQDSVTERFYAKDFRAASLVARTAQIETPASAAVIFPSPVRTKDIPLVPTPPLYPIVPEPADYTLAAGIACLSWVAGKRLRQRRSRGTYGPNHPRRFIHI